jgi:hypothetical protein
MARFLLIAAALCPLAACGSSSAASSSAGSSAGTAAAHCGPAAAKTLARSAQARIYTRAGTVYGCAAGSPHPVRLGSTGRCPGGSAVGVVTAAGRLAAYSVRSCGVDTSSAQVIVRRLTDGHQLSSHAAYSGPVAPESFQSVGSVVATPGGKVAWIVSSSSILAHRRNTEVVAAAGGATHVLASGTGIAPASLQLHSGTLSWTSDWARHTAALP